MLASVVSMVRKGGDDKSWIWGLLPGQMEGWYEKFYDAMEELGLDGDAMLDEFEEEAEKGAEMQTYEGWKDKVPPKFRFPQQIYPRKRPDRPKDKQPSLPSNWKSKKRRTDPDYWEHKEYWNTLAPDDMKVDRPATKTIPLKRKKFLKKKKKMKSTVYQKGKRRKRLRTRDSWVVTQRTKNKSFYYYHGVSKTI